MSSFVNIGEWLVEAPDGVTLSFSKTRLNVSVDYTNASNHVTEIKFLAPESGPSGLEVPVSLSITNHSSTAIKSAFWGVETMGGIHGAETLTGHPNNYAHFHNAVNGYAPSPRWIEGQQNFQPGQTAVVPANGTLVAHSPDPPGPQSGSFVLYFHGDHAPAPNPFDVIPSKGDMLPPLMKATPMLLSGGGPTATAGSSVDVHSSAAMVPFDL